MFITKSKSLSDQNSSYKQIVKSTGIFGGVQVFTILLGVIRQKAIAVLLGPVGLGLISTFQSVVDMLKSVSTLGIDTAGVKDIASSADNAEQQSYKISVFKWWVMLTSGFGSLLCLVFCYPISLFAFEKGDYALHIAALSICIFFSSLSMGQMVILQGTRNIVFLAKANLWGNAVGLVISLALYWTLGERGIIPAFITGSIVMLFFSAKYSRKIKVIKYPVTRIEAFEHGLAPLRLGAFIVAVSIMDTASLLLIKAFLIRTLGENEGLLAIGTLQPAWTITYIYFSLILKSIGTDFFPRLCSISGNASNMRTLVNEQTHIALLVMIPMVVIMMMFSKNILPILYSSEFSSGTHLLQWYVLACFFKVMSWPMAFMLLARNKGLYFLLIEIVYFVVYLGVSYYLFPYLGVTSVGVAYLAAYIAYFLVTFAYVAKAYSFRFTKLNIAVTAIGLFLIFLSCLCIKFMPGYLFISGIVLGILSLAYSLYMFNKVMKISDLIEKIKRRLFSRK